jgi:O-antigen/teichoic acid export membrane protein
MARGGTHKVLGGVLNGVFTYLFAVLLARALGRDASGAFFVAIAILTLGEALAGLGTDVGVVRQIAGYLAVGRIRDVRTVLRVAYLPAVVATVLAGIGMFVFAEPLAIAFDHQNKFTAEIVLYIRMLAVVLPLSVLFDLSIAVTRGFGTMTPDVMLDKIAKAGLQLVLVVVLVGILGLRGPALALTWGLPIAVCFVLGLMWMRTRLHRAERRARRNLGEESVEVPAAPRAEVAREFWRFSAPRALSGVFKVGIDRIAILLVAGLASVGDASVYTASLRYLAAGQFLSLAIMQVMAPRISEFLAARRTDDARAVYQVASGWSMVLTWPVYLSLAGFAPLLLAVFGEKFVAGSGAMVIVAGAMLLSTAFGPVTVVLLMGGKSSLNLVNTMAALIVNVALNFLLIPVWGLEGAAVAWFASIAVNNLLPLWQVHKHLHLHPFGKGFGRAMLASTLSFGVVGVLVRLAMGTTIASLAVYALIAGPLYLAFLWKFREPLELTSLKGALKGKAGGKKPPAPQAA